MNLVDSIIGYWAPGLALKREASRAAMEEFRKYDASSKGRRTSGWVANSTSANTEMLLALQIIRDRSRELVRNNPFAKNAIDVISTNTIGTGIRANITKISTGTAPTDAVDPVVTRLRTDWSAWAESIECDHEGDLDFYGLQSLAMRCVAESGSVLILRMRPTSKKMKTVPLKLRLVEPDLIDSTRDNPVLGNGGYIQQGIEFDKEGVRVAYWLYPRHPGEQFSHTMISFRIPAEDVIHIYRKERAGQINGVPFGASAMIKLRDFDDYEDAELVRQKIAACFAVFITDTSANAITGKKATDTLPERVEPGIIERLPAGKTVQFASPPVTQGYDGYTRRVLQAIAVGYGVTYEALTGDLTSVNFSSGRMGWLEFHRRVTDWRNNIIIPGMCNKVFAWFLEAAGLMGVQSKGIKTTWTSPRREMLDPVKETLGISSSIRNGLISWSDAVREQGRDPDEVLKQLIADKKKFDDAGLILECDAANDSPPPTSEVPTTDGGTTEVGKTKKK